MSLCVGVLAVVAIVTVGAVTSDVFVATSEQQFGRQMTVTAALTGVDLDVEHIDAMLESGSVLERSGGGFALTASTSSVSGMATLDAARSGSPYQSQVIEYVAGRLDHVRRLPILNGTWLDVDATVPLQLVVNRPASRRWGGVGTPLSVLGSPASGPMSALVVGVIADGSPEPHVYASMKAEATLAHPPFAPGSVQAVMHYRQLTTSEFATIAASVARAGSGTVTDDDVVRLDNVDSLLSELHSQQLAFLAVGALTLLVSALGILNIGLASVSERSRELVVRRAVGATRAAIVGQVLVAGMILGVLSAAASVAIAVAAVRVWVPSRIPVESAIVPPGVPWSAVAWGVAAAIVTTLVGSLLPAAVAGRLDVAGALRD